MADITMLRREMQVSTPNTHGALTFMVPAMEGAAKNAGKKSFFGADKGAKALATFLDTFNRAVYPLYDDELVSVDDDLPTVFGALSSQLERFAKAYPNWPEAYQFAQFFFSTENRHVHIRILQEAREFRRYLDAPRINYKSSADQSDDDKWWETDPRIKKVMDARKT